MRSGRPAHVEGIQRIPIFRSLGPRYLRLLSGLLSRRQVAKGERLYREGQPCARFVIVLQGRLNILKTSTGGREKVVGEVRPNEHFGLAEIITGRRCNATVEATEPSVVLALSREDLVRTLLDNPQMCLQLMRTMAGTIMDLSNQVQEVSFERVSVRLARLLVSAADRHGARMEGRVVIRRRYSHRELGRQVGASRETVTRMLKRFRRLGLVAAQRRELAVVDRTGLLRIIEGGGVDDEGEPSH